MTDYLMIARKIARERKLSQADEAKASLDVVLKGRALELWSDALGERFWLVGDGDDVASLGEPRGSVYTAAEARRIITIADPAIVAEVHRWKRQFEATLAAVEFVDETRRQTHRPAPNLVPLSQANGKSGKRTKR